MKKHMRLILLSIILLAVATPAQANYRWDFLYLGHYRFIAAMMVMNPRVVVLATTASVLSTASRRGQLGLGSSFYEASDIPSWDFDVSVGASYVDSDQMGIATSGFGNTFESSIKTIYTGGQARYGRWTFGGTVTRESIVGKATNGSGLTHRTTGLTLVPEYQLLTQNDNGVNLDLGIILDASHATYTASREAWYIRPGVKAAVSRMTEVGLFQVSGNYTYLRNISGLRDTFSGKNYIRSYGMAFDYVCLFTDKIYGNVGVSNIKLMDLPAGGAAGFHDSYTDLNVRAGAAITDQIGVDAGYFQAIDTRHTSGFNLRGVWRF